MFVVRFRCPSTNRRAKQARQAAPSDRTTTSHRRARVATCDPAFSPASMRVALQIVFALELSFARLDEVDR